MKRNNNKKQSKKKITTNDHDANNDKVNFKGIFHPKSDEKSKIEKKLTKYLFISFGFPVQVRMIAQ